MKLYGTALQLPSPSCRRLRRPRRPVCRPKLTCPVSVEATARPPCRSRTRRPVWPHFLLVLKPLLWTEESLKSLNTSPSTEALSASVEDLGLDGTSASPTKRKSKKKAKGQLSTPKGDRTSQCMGAPFFYFFHSVKSFFFRLYRRCGRRTHEPRGGCAAYCDAGPTTTQLPRHHRGRPRNVPVQRVSHIVGYAQVAHNKIAHLEIATDTHERDAQVVIADNFHSSHHCPVTSFIPSRRCVPSLVATAQVVRHIRRTASGSQGLIACDRG